MHWADFHPTKFMCTSSRLRVCFEYLGFFFTSDKTLNKIERSMRQAFWCSVSSNVSTVLVKRELSLNSNLLIYQSFYSLKFSGVAGLSPRDRLRSSDIQERQGGIKSSQLR